MTSDPSHGGRGYNAWVRTVPCQHCGKPMHVLCDGEYRTHFGVVYAGAPECPCSKDSAPPLE